MGWGGVWASSAPSSSYSAASRTTSAAFSTKRRVWQYTIRVTAIVALLCAFRQLIMDAIRAVVRFLTTWWSGQLPRREGVRKSKVLAFGRPLSS